MVIKLKSNWLLHHNSLDIQMVRIFVKDESLIHTTWKNVIVMKIPLSLSAFHESYIVILIHV